MKANLTTLRRIIDRHCVEPTTRTIIPGLLLFRADEPTTPMDVVYEPRFCIIVQGSKTVTLCDKVFEYNSQKYLITAVDLPVKGCVTQASKEHPYLSLCISLSPEKIKDLINDIGSHESDLKSICPSCITTSELTNDIFDPVFRLLSMLDNPQDIPVLYESIMREILYRLLQGPQGYVLRQIATVGSNLSHLNRAIDWIRDHYREAFDIASLAQVAGMSTPSFHRHFRAATMMSPLQYRNRIRLQEARRLMLNTNMDAAEAGFCVGYESPSQFSREYRRMFGAPPASNVKYIKQ